MTLHDEIATLITDIRLKDPDEAADAILALVRAHLTSDEAVERTRKAFYVATDPSSTDDWRAANLAALGEGE